MSISRSQACCRACAALVLLHAYVLLWCSVLGSRGDQVSVSLRLPCTAISRAAGAWAPGDPWTARNPLHEAFDPHKLRRLYPADISVSEMRR